MTKTIDALVEALEAEKEMRLYGKLPECGKEQESLLERRRAVYEATDAALAQARAEQAEPYEITEEMLQAGANAPYTSTEGIGIKEMFGTESNVCDWRGALRLIYTAMREAAHNAKLGNK